MKVGKNEGLDPKHKNEGPNNKNNKNEVNKHEGLDPKNQNEGPDNTNNTNEGQRK